MKSSILNLIPSVASRLFRIILIAVCFAAASALSSCASQQQLYYERMNQEYDPNLDGYNYADDYDDYYYDYMGY